MCSSAKFSVLIAEAVAPISEHERRVFRDHQTLLLASLVHTKAEVSSELNLD